ncbi:MAG: hypothetical protein LC785_10195 [Acidobacteria bacterium]|nr:hypothetical protein [Acidobacteriota bacterium]
MSIIISKKGKNAQKLDTTIIAEESYLQQYISDNPNSLPLDEIAEDIRLLILAREFPTRSGKIDALGIDDDGNIYVIETKLYKNADKRVVLAQVLDYGASLWRTYEDTDLFLEELERAADKMFNEPLAQKVQKFYETDVETVADIRQSIRRNLRDGNFRFVVLMDHLEDRLRDLLLFVNQNSNFNIYGVEMRFYKFEDYEILIPQLYGAEVKKSVGIAKPPSSSRESTEIHKAIVRMIDRPLRKNEIMHRLRDAGMQIGEKTLQRRLKEAVDWGDLASPLKGYYSPIQPKG